MVDYNPHLADKALTIARLSRIGCDILDATHEAEAFIDQDRPGKWRPQYTDIRERHLFRSALQAQADLNAWVKANVSAEDKARLMEYVDEDERAL